MAVAVANLLAKNNNARSFRQSQQQQRQLTRFRMGLAGSVNIEKTAAMVSAERGTAKKMDNIWRTRSNSAQRDIRYRTRSRLNRSEADFDNAESESLLGNGTGPCNWERKRDVIVTKAKCLRLNVGGVSYMLLVESLLAQQKSANGGGFLARFALLTHADRVQIADGYFANSDEYFFQRSPSLFEPIFQFYATGVVHRPCDLCPDAFLAELRFWEVAEQHIGSCCTEGLFGTHTYSWSDNLGCSRSQVDENEARYFDGQLFSATRKRLWHCLEAPGAQSSPAKMFELTSALFVLVSVASLSLATIPELQVYVVTTANVTFRQGNETKFKLINTTVKEEHPLFRAVESGCIGFFTLEYLLRVIVAPRRGHFMVQPLNLVDLLAILPFYVEQALFVLGVDEARLSRFRWAFLVVRILRVLRVIRVIKLGRFSSGLQTFALTMRRSQKQLQMMTVVLLTGIVFFSTMIYFLEKDVPRTPFASIPAAYWWCIVTMTTVGYGDAVPSTVLGKVVASVTIMCGVLVLALPITVIVDNFIKVAQEDQEHQFNQPSPPHSNNCSPIIVNTSTKARAASAADEELSPFRSSSRRKHRKSLF